MTDKILDNITGQEIKELIAKGKISIEKLDAPTLNKLIKYETDMLCFGKGDIEFICRCSDQLDIISNNPITDDEFYNAIKKAKSDYAVETESAEEGRKNIVSVKKHFVNRRICIVAAIILMIVTTALTAVALGVNVFENVFEYIRNMVFEPEGTYISADSLTFYNAGETNNYASIEELINAEQLNIMYPLEFPENIHITSVRVNASEIGEKNIMVLTNDQNIIIDINTEVSHTDNTFGDCEKYEHNGCTYYIFKDELLNRYSGYCIYNNNEYVISTDSYKNLLIIIKGMKE